MPVLLFVEYLTGARDVVKFGSHKLRQET